MGKIKQAIIDDPTETDPTKVYTPYTNGVRVYSIDEKKVPSDIFIRELALALYLHTPIDDIRETIDNLVEDENGREMLTIGSRNFFSYRVSLTVDEAAASDIRDAQENAEYPKKKYFVGYDITIIPTIQERYKRGALGKQRLWKRFASVVEARGFREARDIIRDHYKDDKDNRKIKNIRIKECPEDYLDYLRGEYPKADFDNQVVVELPGVL